MFIRKEMRIIDVFTHSSMIGKTIKESLRYETISFNS